MEFHNIALPDNTTYYQIKSEVDPVATLIFIHGFPFDHTIWSEQLKSLPPTIQGVAYDIRGFGSSSTSHHHFSIDLFAQDLLAFIKNKGFTNCILCGVSMGGYIALRAFEIFPEYIKGLVLSDTNCIGDSNEAKIKRFASVQEVLAEGKKQFTDDFIKNVFSEDTLQNKPDVVSFLHSVIENTSDKSVCATLIAMASRTSTSHVLPTVDVPVLIIRGVEDKLMTAEQADQLKNGIENSILIDIPLAGHLPNLETPEDFNKALNSYLIKHFSI
jgi:pimeloyl-ACP methyl ester carboxylesterase